MFDKEFVLEILSQILQALKTISSRFKFITKTEDFTSSPEGMEKLDSICMLFIATGESIKKLDKITSGNLFSRYPEIDWKGVMGFRDIISHHYFDIDAEEVYYICKNELPRLIITIEKIIKEQK